MEPCFCLSDEFRILRQWCHTGGVLSTIFYLTSMSMSIISKLEHMDHGCSICGTLFGGVMHADDVGLLVLSASVNGLQLMINACRTYGDYSLFTM